MTKRKKRDEPAEHNAQCDAFRKQFNVEPREGLSIFREMENSKSPDVLAVAKFWRQLAHIGGWSANFFDAWFGARMKANELIRRHGLPGARAKMYGRPDRSDERGEGR